MFAIYTPNGRAFSGPLEELYRVQKMQSSEKNRGFEEIDEFSLILKKDHTPSKKALNAYQTVVNKPNKKELTCHAYQVMTSPVEVIAASDLLSDVIKKFAQVKYQEFPIVDNHHRPIGRLSRQKFYEYMLENGLTAKKENKNVAELFLNDESKIDTAEPVTDIRRIASLQINNNLTSIPILENNGQIVGIISRTDIIKAVIMDPPLSLWC